MDHASTRVSPNSTYKIYDALLGLESGIITPEHSTFTWNGEPYPFNSWEADQDLTSAIHNSVNWYFQAIDSQAGFEAVRTFLQTINYGNQNTGTNLNLYWTDFSLKISPIEQVELLQDFYQNNFHFDSKNIQAVKKPCCFPLLLPVLFTGKQEPGVSMVKMSMAGLSDTLKQRIILTTSQQIFNPLLVQLEVRLPK